ncbi:MAG TPA: glycosyltransferase, partial [Anaerolineae bacterium]|nr:glycosyltransferase [Anaerolineae bacterium]
MGKRILLLTYGTRGDVQPCMALGLGLKEAGHEVVIAAPMDHEEFVREWGLDFRGLPGDVTAFSARLVSGGRNPIVTAREVTEYALPIGREIWQVGQEVTQGFDLIIHTFLMTLLGHQAAVKQGIPDISLQFFPLFADTLPLLHWDWAWRPYRWVVNGLYNQVYWWLNRFGYAWLRRGTDMPAWDMKWPFRDRPGRAATPMMLAVSPLLVPQPEAAWTAPIKVSGFLELPVADDWEPEGALAEFLAAGEKPVFVGFGSMVSDEAERLRRVVEGALAECGLRGVLYGGWGGLKGTEEVSERVHFLEGGAPFSRLFPLMRGVVHHGG